ncbi:hypothetical protein AMAG_00739 [Allomyces macrogynus ATCC 38327]|uniref:Uncharacterized protein n=1 Tax=Allomyces macrogynus (strain ATCC 38327) TaxID=578462 RepID=A0A0L0RXA9_ALLM3|nr:hypothetical protein AMAG_00739 [Allomyces macrogynus ATCC 38327]|eukprot:KNE54785.1 hypothetical protein AMAG_00739 [Allomyces macrogynus ATCC 38327]
MAIPNASNLLQRTERGLANPTYWHDHEPQLAPNAHSPARRAKTAIKSTIPSKMRTALAISALLVAVVLLATPVAVFGDALPNPGPGPAALVASKSGTDDHGAQVDMTRSVDPLGPEVASNNQVVASNATRTVPDASTPTAATTVRAQVARQPEYSPYLACSLPHGWEYFAAHLTAFYGTVFARQPRGAEPVVDKEGGIGLSHLFSDHVRGRINILGSLQGMQANSLFLETLPQILLRQSNWTLTSVVQSHFAVTCGIVAAVHDLTFTAPTPPPTDPSSTASTSADTPSSSAKNSDAPSTESPRGVRGLFQRMLRRSAAASAPPTPTLPPATPNARTHVFSVWSWWHFDLATGFVREYDVAVHRRAHLDWTDLLPASESMVDTVCRAAAPCNATLTAAGTAMLAGEPAAFAGESECRAAVERMEAKQVMCRYIAAQLASDHPVTACLLLGPQSTLCGMAAADAHTWAQRAEGGDGDAQGEASDVPRIPRHVEL